MPLPLLLVLAVGGCATQADSVGIETDTGAAPDTGTDPDTRADSDTDSAADTDTGAPADHDGDGFAEGEDCDDDNPAANPGETEIRDGVDNDCDGRADNVRWTGDGSLDDAVVRVRGRQEYDEVGTLFCGAGDQNGDGVDDLLAAITIDFSYSIGGGYLTLLHGPVADDADLNLPDASVNNWGINPGGIVRLGDVNDDGVDDFAAVDGGLFADSEHQADAWWIPGPIRGTTDLVSSGSLIGTAQQAIAAAGDHDGDGTQDLVTGDPNYDYYDVGQIVLWAGPSLLKQATVTGIDEYEHLQPARSTSDLNGDGLPDLVASSDQTAASGPTGVVHTFFGPLSGDLDRSAADATITGDAIGDAFLRVVPGDLDGDGYGDLAVGAPNRGVPDDYAGAVYVFFGPPSSGGAAGADAIIEGAAAWSMAGDSVEVIDLDGDGTDDLLCAAEGAGYPHTDHGMTSLSYGPIGVGTRSFADSDASWTSAAAYDRGGHRVEAVGDLDDDGYSDFGVGAPYDNGNGDMAGALYLFGAAP